jgi:hypothetical protein
MHNNGDPQEDMEDMAAALIAAREDDRDRSFKRRAADEAKKDSLQEILQGSSAGYTEQCNLKVPKRFNKFLADELVKRKRFDKDLTKGKLVVTAVHYFVEKNP